MVAIDITEYGDPLNTRSIRMPFSLYLKPWLKGGILTEELYSAVPAMMAIPMADLELSRGILIMRDHREAIELAEQGDCRIPSFDHQTLALIEDYRRSRMADFHDSFFAEQSHPPQRWPATYDALDLAQLSGEVRHILQHPNDLLLRPRCLRAVVDQLLDLGWHPRHAAGLIRSKYERDFGWGWRWYVYDAASRAEFYTRLFAAPHAMAGAVSERAA